MDDMKTRDCLLKEHEHWNMAKCIDIATQTDNRRFMSHNACQTLINDIWMGNLVDTHSTGNMRVNSRVVRKVCTQREKESDLNSPYDKTPFTNRKLKKKITTPIATKNFNLAMIVGLLRTTSDIVNRSCILYSTLKEFSNTKRKRKRSDSVL